MPTLPGRKLVFSRFLLLFMCAANSLLRAPSEAARGRPGLALAGHPPNGSCESASPNTASYNRRSNNLETLTPTFQQIGADICRGWRPLARGLWCSGQATKLTPGLVKRAMFFFFFSVLTGVLRNSFCPPTGTDLVSVGGWFNC